MAANYAKVGPELHEMADEGLVLAARAKARLGQSLCAAQHTEGHLQVAGEASDVPQVPAPRGTPSLASCRGRKIRSRHQSSSDAERNGLIHERRGRGILRTSDARSCIDPPLRSARMASKALSRRVAGLYMLWCWMDMQRDE